MMLMRRVVSSCVTSPRRRPCGAPQYERTCLFFRHSNTFS